MMHQPERKNIANGYIVKLYRRAENVSEKTILDDSMFMTWMNFDCMDVVKIYNFQEYHNMVDVSLDPPREIYASWQKLFLYKLNGENSNCFTGGEEEILLPGDSLKSFPLITVSMLNICQRRNENGKLESKKWYEEKLHHFLKEYTDHNDDVKGGIFGSLAVYDYVLVLRGCDYRKLDAALAACKEKMRDQGIVFNKIYSVAGIDRKNLSAWNTEGLWTSIRLSCTSDLTKEQLKSSEELKAAVKDHEVYSILGKYDYDIVGEIKSSEKFVALFLKGGILSAFETSIHKSNTRFFNTDSRYCVNSDRKLITEEQVTGDISLEVDVQKNCRLWEYFFERYSKINSLPPSIMEALSRLLLRTFQVIETTNNVRMAEDLKKKLYDFLDFIYYHQNDYQMDDIWQDRVQDVYAGMINTFNLLLDNRVSIGMSDFEAPQNVLRYSGASMKVLLAYSAYVDELIDILSHNKIKEAGREAAIKYIALVTADPIARICATVSLSYSEYYRFINISIPIDLMFEVGNVLPWVTHEAGHFIRAGWHRADRNAAYFTSVARGVLDELMPYATPLLYENIGNNLFEGKTVPVVEGEKFSSYCKYVTQYFQMTVYRFATDYSREFRIPYNRSRTLLDDVENIAEGLKRIYEEAIADMFMLEILGIENLTDYLIIQEAYFRRLHIDIHHLPKENISRIFAVSVVLEKLPSDNYEKSSGYFSVVYSNSQNDNIRPIIKQLKEFDKYYLLEPLVEFLVEYVKKGIGELLKNPKTANIQKKLRDSYSCLKKGGFKEYLQFVLQFSE